MELTQKGSPTLWTNLKSPLDVVWHCAKIAASPIPKKKTGVHLLTGIHLCYDIIKTLEAINIIIISIF
jgi:hypothetical protein